MKRDLFQLREKVIWIVFLGLMLVLGTAILSWRLQDPLLVKLGSAGAVVYILPLITNAVLDCFFAPYFPSDDEEE